MTTDSATSLVKDDVTGVSEVFEGRTTVSDVGMMSAWVTSPDEPGCKAVAV